jgi:hypothetical protein
MSTQPGKATKENGVWICSWNPEANSSSRCNRFKKSAITTKCSYRHNPLGWCLAHWDGKYEEPKEPEVDTTSMGINLRAALVGK